MIVSCLLFDRLTTLDAIGPVTVLARMPGTDVQFVGLYKGEVRSVQSGLGLITDHDLESAPQCDLLLVPGGPGVRALLDNEPALSWIRKTHRDAQWTASVCTGALLLGAAGLLKGHDATTHWNAQQELATYGARPTRKRIVVSGNIITAAGVSAGIDMALTLVSLVRGEDIARAIQLKIEYDPAPPFDGGSPDKESIDIVALARGALTGHR